MARGFVAITVEHCKGCGFCVEFCPTHVLALSSAYNSKGYHPPNVVDRDRPDYMELLKAQMSETLGERFAEPQCISEDGGCCESEGATVCS